MPGLEILVGMIASGKSQYARTRADEGAMVVCHDDLTQMIHARYRYDPALRNLYRRMEESLAGDALADGRDVVIDRTHLTRESRQRWLDFAWTMGARPYPIDVTIVAVRFPIETPEIHARRRMADSRGRPYEEWLRVAQHHATQAETEPLRLDEGFAIVTAPAFAGPAVEKEPVGPGKVWDT